MAKIFRPPTTLVNAMNAIVIAGQGKQDKDTQKQDKDTQIQEIPTRQRPVFLQRKIVQSGILAA
jgi:hypothetical protein